MNVIQAIRKSIPHPPTRKDARGGGPLRNYPPSDDPNDSATRRWLWRHARRVGIQRVTVSKWLRQGPPIVIENALVVTACLRKEAALTPSIGPFHTCQRGRR